MSSSTLKCHASWFSPALDLPREVIASLPSSKNGSRLSSHLLLTVVAAWIIANTGYGILFPHLPRIIINSRESFTLQILAPIGKLGPFILFPMQRVTPFHGHEGKKQSPSKYSVFAMYVSFGIQEMEFT